uniref:IS3 family transposase n=1 Tax=Serratia marcescens TaxID=615 RepID=UPI00356B6E73
MVQYTEEFRRKVVQHYLSTHDGVKRTAKIFGVHKATIQLWISTYRKHGEDIAISDKKRRKYAPAVKEAVIHDILNNQLSVRQAAAKFNISRLQLARWLESYKNGGMEALSVMKKRKQTNTGAQAKKTEFLTPEDELDYLRAENAYLKKLQALFSKATAKTQVVDELRSQHKLNTLLRVAELPRSTFFYQKKRLSNESHRDEKEKITSIFHQHKGRYGYRRITVALKREGIKINHKTVYKLMKNMGLSSPVRRKKYNSYKGMYGKVAPNLLNREFTAVRPNQKWATDVTEFSVNGEKLYLSPIVDLFNREIISFSLARRPHMGMINTMLRKAFSKINDAEKPVLHSDQGWQYQMIGYQEILQEKQVVQSMSRKGNCLDNAVVENFFGTLKSECFYLNTFNDINELETAIREYIHYYNHERISLRLQGLSPVEFRTQTLQAA